MKLFNSEKSKGLTIDTLHVIPCLSNTMSVAIDLN